MPMAHRKKAYRKAPRRRIHRRAKPQTQIIVRPPKPRPWELTQTEIELVKSQLCPGATDKEFEFNLARARHMQLDPFKRQCHFVPFRNEDAATKKSWQLVVAIDGLHHLAARDHKDFGSYDEPEWGPMHKIEWREYKNGNWYDGRPFEAPEWARIAAWKKGAERPTVAKVFWSEIYPNVSFSPKVRSAPRLMLAKCADAQATRRAYPETGGVYIPEEFQGPETKLWTSSGRWMELPPDPGGQPVDANPHLKRFLESLPPEQRAAEEEALRKHNLAQQELIAKKRNETKRDRATVLDIPSREVKPEPPKEVPYTWANDTQTARIDKGPAVESLSTDVKRILLRFWREDLDAIVMNGEQFDGIRYEFEKRQIALKLVK